MKPFKTKSIFREHTTIKAMIEMFCYAKHKNNKELCKSCDKLLNYSKERLYLCPFHSRKFNCKNCKIHCYQNQFRGQIIEVMKFSGPRMIFKHPVLCFAHIYNEFKTLLNKITKK